MDATQFKEVLAKDFPDLMVSSCELLGEGWDNAALLVNGTYVVRMPKNRQAVSDKRRQRGEAEIALLRFLQHKLPVKIPEPVLVAPDRSYFGYTYLPGKTLYELKPDEWGEGLRQSFATAWVEVATTIPQVLSVEEARRLGLEDFGSMERYCAQTQQLVESDKLPAWAQAIAADTAQRLLPKWGEAKKHAVPSHGDLGLTNWLTEDNERVSALIDFSDACIAPIEYQMSYWVWESPEKLQQVVRDYERTTGYAADVELIFLAKFASFFAELDQGSVVSEEQLASLKQWQAHFEGAAKV